LADQNPVLELTAVDTSNNKILEQTLALKKRQLRLMSARKRLDDFIHMMMPDPEHPEDSEKSEYQKAPHALLLCDVIHQAHKGSLMRSAISIPPQHGKTIHISVYGVAWLIGMDPKRRIIVATYNETRAEELGEMVRNVLNNPIYKTIFPDVELDTGSKSKSAMSTTANGRLFFVGTGGTVTGRTADFFLIDDPIKDDEDIQSDNSREKLWKWFFSVAYSRGSKTTRMVVLHTRWHADDLIGRLCDPHHPEREKRFEGIADDWTYLNISGVVTDERLAKTLGLPLEIQTDPKIVRAFGEDKPMAALWEADKDLAHFAAWKIGDPRTFSALVMGQPTIEDGEYFRADWLMEYSRDELPTDLRIYGASDHAVSMKANRDSTVLGCIGVDSQDNIYVLPDIVWARMETDRTVNELLHQFRTHKPQLWWMESELISKAFGPFLRKRMIEERTYVTIDPVKPSADKAMVARSIQGRMMMGKVFFPRFAPWWAVARSQLLQFPYGAHDDFVTFISLIGLGLLRQAGPAVKVQHETVIQTGSPLWTLRQTAVRARQEKRQRSIAGW
jgi:predicted phage terminase large subunit-like protein